MPLINKPFEYSQEELTRVQNKIGSENFSHHSWGDDDIEHIRSRIRKFYRSQQQGICAYCKAPVSTSAAVNAQIEHIVPKSLHTKFTFEPKNMCVVCADCNEIKRQQEVTSGLSDTLRTPNIRYPRSSRAFKIVHPHFDNYDEHILVKGRIYVDKTDKGAFTISVCKLNRFTRNFQVDEEFADDEELIREMNRFMEANSTLEKLHALQNLRDMLW